ncbi:uncharacterized protein LOC123535175 [Mercenaria mercenaria]|uniref:uncharacterized protein LOC123535175 n=1 Tax=Mercenaria mercenaria TaxID=6596 RepID=UPI00234FB493|nr:uncharacterized protein LOC123535175 [Mercenaria mercenaria]XP_053376014.1 uncharacterized protein LOC123535175 [Mercenaria mercenaria]
MSTEKEINTEGKGIDGAVQSLIDTSTLGAAIAEPEEFVEDYCEQKRIERRRPRIKHIPNCREKTTICIKITCVYMLSYVGLTCIVVGYSILGGFLFRALEEANEERVDQNALDQRHKFSIDLDNDISEHFRSALHSFSDPVVAKLRENALAIIKDEIETNMEKFKNDVTQQFNLNERNQTDYRNHQNQSHQDQNHLRGLLRSKQDQIEDAFRVFGNDLVNDTVKSIRTRLYKSLSVKDSLKHSLKYNKFKLNTSKIHKFQLDTYELVNRDGWNGVDPDSEEGAKWTYAGGLLYAVTVITTIGYGTITPKTDAGRAVTILYALIGIPLTVLCITNIGRGMASVCRAIYGGTFCVECRQQFFNSLKTRRLSSIATDDFELEKVNQDGVSETEVVIHKHQEVPIFISLILVTLYILFGAIMFKFWEGNWKIFESAYFCFITLSTIGFGDFVPGFSDKDWDNQVKQVACSLYLLIGLSTLAMCFDLMQQRGKEIANQFASFIGLVRKDKADRHENHV